MDAPEMSPLALADIAGSKDTSGLQLAQRILSNAAVQVRNDMLAVLSDNNMLVDATSPVYGTSVFKEGEVPSASSDERGLKLIKSNPRWRKSVRKLVIKNIKIYALEDADAVEVKIYDSGLDLPITTTYEFDLVGDRVNTFLVNYEVLGEHAIVALAGVDVGSSYLATCAGCSGKVPNDCAYTESYNNGRSIAGREGYGVGVDFICECDYDKLLCNLSKTTLGNLIWMKARVMLLNERLQTERANNWVVYGREEIKDYYLPKLESEYDAAWKPFVKSLPQILKSFSGECITCNGIRSVISV